MACTFCTGVSHLLHICHVCHQLSLSVHIVPRPLPQLPSLEMITEASYSAPAAGGPGNANALQAASMQHANGLHSPLDPVVAQPSPHAQQSIGSPVTPASAVAAAATLPSSFMCPLTGGMMTDPVVAADGVTYERAAINEWLQQRDVSPVTGMPLSSRCVHLLCYAALM